MVFESIENQEAIGDGGYECNSTSFEQKASIDSNGVSFHRTVGVLHIALNRVVGFPISIIINRNHARIVALLLFFITDNKPHFDLHAELL